MDANVEVSLIAPAKIGGKRVAPGASVYVSEALLHELARADAIPPLHAELDGEVMVMPGAFERQVAEKAREIAEAITTVAVDSAVEAAVEDAIRERDEARDQVHALEAQIAEARQQIAALNSDIARLNEGQTGVTRNDPVELVGGESTALGDGVSIYAQTWETTRLLTGG